MPHVILEREGLKMEADLSLADIKELMGLRSSSLNGHIPIPAALNNEQRQPIPAALLSPQEQLDQFMRGLSERGRQFVQLLKEHPKGIEVNQLVSRLGFTTASQIGGLTGGGLAKVAKRTGVRLPSIYRTQITTPNGVRTVTFYPGKSIASEKPA